jgi:beta-lactam-binding protein with PASTA domain
MKKQKKIKEKTYKMYGYKVIFYSEYPYRKVEEVLGGHLDEAMAELAAGWNDVKQGKKKRPTYFLQMSNSEIDDSIDNIFK